MFSAVTTSLVLICVKYVNPVDVMLWKGWKSRELVWECKATQDFPTIIASTILLSYNHCPNYHTILLSLLLYIYGRHFHICPQNGFAKFACRPRLWQTKYKELWRL